LFDGSVPIAMDELPVNAGELRQRALTIHCWDPNLEAAWLRLDETLVANGSCPELKKELKRSCASVD
jgi:hypothetical protein